MRTRRHFDFESAISVYDGFVDQNPTEFGTTPFHRQVEEAYFDGLHTNESYETGDFEGWECRAAFLAGRDLREGKVERGTNDLIDQWIGFTGHINGPPNIAFARHRIKHLMNYPKTLALRHEGTIYYQWGALAGHAFPATAKAYRRADSREVRGVTFGQMARGIEAVLAFDKANFNTRKHTFHQLLLTIARGEVPATMKAYRIFIVHGPAGLMQHYFGGRFNAAVQNAPIPKGTSHFRLKYRVGQKDAEYFLVDMDDAVMLKMTNPKVRITDLSQPLGDY